jgi:hypothetical protein
MEEGDVGSSSFSMMNETGQKWSAPVRRPHSHTTNAHARRGRMTHTHPTIRPLIKLGVRRSRHRRGCRLRQRTGAATRTVATRPSRASASVTAAPAAPASVVPSLDAQSRRFRRFVRTQFAGVGWADTITDAYVGGFVPTLNATTASGDPEVALGVCSAINL